MGKLKFLISVKPFFMAGILATNANVASRCRVWCSGLELKGSLAEQYKGGYITE